MRPATTAPGHHPRGRFVLMARQSIRAAALYLRDLALIAPNVDHVRKYGHGARATYMGNNRVLVKLVLRGHCIAYLVEADDLLISPWFIITGSYETRITKFLLRNLRSDSNCLDVGANFGYFACLMARFCPDGQVLAVEPDPQVFPLLRDNLAINGFADRATGLHAAVADSERMITLYRRDLRSANTSIVAATEAFTRLMGEPPVEPFAVAATTIDTLATTLGGRVDFLKIDVEGAEPLVLAGARETIAANPQIQIVMDWSPGQIEAAGF